MGMAKRGVEHPREGSGWVAPAFPAVSAKRSCLAQRPQHLKAGPRWR